MAIKDWPLAERPREKLLERGALALSDAELVAIILRKGIKGKTALDVARDLLMTHGGLRPLFNAQKKEICSMMGIGEHTFAQLQAVKELGKRVVQENMLKNPRINHIEASKQYMQSKLQDHDHEVFACLFLDNKHRMIRFVELFSGTLNQAVVYPREVVRKALQYNAAAVIIAHNHPSGDPTPSSEDLSLTIQIKNALLLVDIKLLDHIVIGSNHLVSCAELGYL